MKIAFTETSRPTTGAIVVAVMEGSKLGPEAAQLDRALGGALKRAIKASRFTGKRHQVLDVVAPHGLKAGRVVLYGGGKPKALTVLDLQAFGGRLSAHLNSTGVKHATVMIGEGVPGVGIDVADRAANIAYGARLRSYRFDKYRTKIKDKDKPSLASLTISLKGAATARRRHGTLEKIADGVFLTRNLVSEPSNVLFPEALAKQAATLAKLGVKVEVLNEKQMAKLGMGALLGVGQGSARPPRLVTMRWNGNPKAKDKRPVAFVGKGVTFDTGGISIKPAPGMEDMKWDMGGSGVVIGLMRALAGRKAKVNAVGVIALAENMPDGNAQRPGDIVTSMSGQTIEVLNTDAEGRLVLADALWYCQEKFKPRAIVDLATLTGAIIICLGNEFAGLFSDDDGLAEKLLAAGKAEAEPLWRMPLCDAYDKDIDTDVADMKNIGSGRGAGSSTAAHFLKRFVRDVPWAHLDIAGVTWSKKSSNTAPKGGTAFGVRLLNRLVADNYEGK